MSVMAWERLMRHWASWLLCLMLVAATGNACANGKLTHLSGQVSVQKTDGATAAAVPGAEVLAGDTLLTGANGYARLETSDGGEMLLRPNSQFHLEQYHYEATKPAEDNFVYSLFKGGLRTLTGLIGKRGNRQAYRGNIATATIGIRGTLFEVRVCAADCGVLQDGTYFIVHSGSIITGNSLGEITMTAGQIVWVPLNAPPQILPRDPGIGFTPPADIPKPVEKPEQAEPSLPSDNDLLSSSSASDSSDTGLSCSIE